MSNKFCSLDELVSYRQEYARQKQTVVFANGCFDILHCGHLDYLQGAATLGDILIVAVNSDRSVRRYKGEDRPIIPEDQRVEILEAIRYIDHLLLFDEPDVNHLLLKLKPDIHAKGTDYTVETVPERNTVLSYGGQVAIAGNPRINSTTNVINKILKNFGSRKKRK